MSEELLSPCPFCGGTLAMVFCIDDGWGNCRYYSDNEAWSVCCEGCSAEGPWGKTREEAIELWDKRHSIVELQKVL
jgi:Lar family restriction alleviation protein